MEIDNVTYIGPESLSAADMKPYVEAPESVPRQVEIADLEKVLESAVQKLFEVEKNNSFATFSAPPLFSLKTLFRRNLLPSVDIDKMVTLLDEYSEDEDEGIDANIINCLLGLGYLVLDKDSILNEIRDRMLSIVKP